MNNKQRKPVKNTDQVRITTSGNTIHLEPINRPGSRSKKQKPGVVVNVVQDISPVGNFLDFLRQHAVVGLIIGFVIGNQVQSLVKQLIQSFVDPLTKLLFGTELSQRTFTLHFHGRYANFSWGAMAYALIIFLFVLIFMYVLIRLLKLEQLDKKEEEK